MSKKTLIHTGLSALINAIYNQNDFIVFIYEPIENAENIYPIPTKQIIESLNIGLDHIWTQEISNLSEIRPNIEQILDASGVRVLLLQ
jgi:TPP-dependent indolepyruvate ferredoxin oxidoreductase alpha subunit